MAGALAGASVSAAPALAQPRGVALGPPQPFSFATLAARAQAIAARVYAPPPPGDPLLDRIDFDAYGQIVYDPAMTLWGGAGEPAVRLFPQGSLFKTPVRTSLVDKGVARPVIYSPGLFQTPAGHPFRRLKGGGFAGFRVMNPEGNGDWLAFLGAAYFRAAGPFNQYGASARGLAINTGGPAKEEFPQFTDFWLERAPAGGLIVYALLDGPSLSGAYRIENHRGAEGVTQTIDVALFFRKPVETLGLAPLTSMFWYGENSPPRSRDWRPEIHDSDGLALATGAGERLWRPLINPPRVLTNAFEDHNPNGFGLLQRDRLFDHYQDDGAFYDKRPSLWVEPKTPFGAGSVRLVELPSSSEIEDNIAAFWTPDRRYGAGESLRYSYTLRWISEPAGGGLARVEATRMGVGGRPGFPAKSGYRRLAIDFAGDSLKGLTRASGVEGIVTASGGARIEEVAAYPVVGTPLWRLIFDVGAIDQGPIDVRAYLRHGEAALSETWLYQVFPER
jgi:glucans biosynthesis protein